MKFNVSSATFCNRLQTISRVQSSKSSLPILDCILFELTDDELTMTASDSETTIVTSLAISDSEGTGCFAIESKQLINSIKEISDQPITIQVNVETLQVEVNYQNGRYNLMGQHPDDYPVPIDDEDTSATLLMPGSMLSDGLSRSLFATADDELRPQMNGIFFDISPEYVTMVASDGHKLVRDRMLSVHGEELRSFILPKKPALLLKSILPKEEGDVQISFSDRNARVQLANYRISCRLIEGRYPNYNSVIPQGNPNVLTIDRLGLLAALRRVQPFANDSSNLIRFHVEGGTLQLDAEDYDFSKTATERMACDYNGQPMSIGFKGASFIEILSNFDCQDVIIQLADPSRAGLVLPSEQPDNQDILMLMMPMLIND